MGIDFPVAVDNDHAIWRAFDNQYWPALYFVDAQGRIRHHHFGEGEYDGIGADHPSSCWPRPGTSAGGSETVSVEGEGVEAAADWASLRSPENYLGYERTVNFASPGGVAGQRRGYTVPTG